jgi:hypothetical protein
MAELVSLLYLVERDKPSAVDKVQQSRVIETPCKSRVQDLSVTEPMSVSRSCCCFRVRIGDPIVRNVPD